jgi:hypothetical protein
MEIDMDVDLDINMNNGSCLSCILSKSVTPSSVYFLNIKLHEQNDYFEIRPSKIIQGEKGLFAKKFIPKYSILWKEHSHCLYYSLDELLSLHSKYIAEHTFFSSYKQSFVFPNDLTMYINHSNTPNSITIDGDVIRTITLQDIYPDEEIFEDYSVYDKNKETELLCRYFNMFSPVYNQSIHPYYF